MHAACILYDFRMQLAYEISVNKAIDTKNIGHTLSGAHARYQVNKVYHALSGSPPTWRQMHQHLDKHGCAIQASQQPFQSIEEEIH